MATTWTITSDINMDAIGSGAWADGDTLNIYNGAVVTCNTSQSKAWTAINIYDGKLRIVNTSNSVVNRFSMIRNSGGVASIPIKPQSALGVIEIQGAWIDLGVGNGGVQSFELPIADFMPVIFVETAPGSGIFDSWLNARVEYGDTEIPRRGSTRGTYAAGNDARGQFFLQDFLPEPYAMTSTLADPWDPTVRFGSDDGCTPVPAGCRIVIPNIHLSDKTAVNYTNTFTHVPRIRYYTSPLFHIDLSLGGILIADKATFEHFHINGTYATSFRMTNCGLSIVPMMGNCSGVYIDNVGITCDPARIYYYNGWGIRDYRAYAPTWALLTNAVIKRLKYWAYASTNSVSTTYGFMFQNAANMTIEDFTLLFTNEMVDNNSLSYRYAFTLDYLADSTLKNIALVQGRMRMSNCTGVTIDGMALAESSFNECLATISQTQFPRNAHIYINPETGEPWEKGIPVYFKFRSYDSYFDVENRYYDALTVPSITPYAGFNGNIPHPYYFGVCPKISSYTWSVYLAWWAMTSPDYYAFTKYEIYRSTAWGTLGSSVYSSATLSTYYWTDSAVSPGTTYYYTMRYWYSATEYTDSAQQIAIIPAALTDANLGWMNNLLAYSFFTASNWTKVSATTTSYMGPTQRDYITGNAACAIYYSAVTGTCSRSITTVVGTTYVFSIWLKAVNNLPGAVQTVDLVIGTTKVTLTLDRRWRRYYAVFTATATATTIGLNANANTLTGSLNNIWQGYAQVEIGTVPGITHTNTSATSSLRPSHEFSVALAHSKEGMRGLEVIPYTGTSGVFGGCGWEIFASTNPNFIPSKNNMVLTNLYDTCPNITLDNTTRSIIKNVTKIGHAAAAASYYTARGFMRLANGSSNNKIMNVDYPLDGGGAILISTDGVRNNSNFFYNMRFRRMMYRNAASTFAADNTNSGNIFQNIYSEFGDNPLGLMSNDTVLKGVAAGWSRADGYGSRFIIGDTMMGLPSAFTNVMDSVFAELQWTDTDGALFLTTCPSSKDSPPYEIISGTPKFNGQGRLYFPNAGDCIEYTWPHKIRGITGFPSAPIVSLVNLLNRSSGSYGWQFEPCGLQMQYAISLDGSTWSAFKDMTDRMVANLAAEELSAARGFYFKIRLTARHHLSFYVATNAYWTQGDAVLAGKTLTSSSGGTCTIERVFYDSATNYGLVWVTNITGDWSGSSSSIYDYAYSASRVGLALGDATYGVMMPCSNSYITHLVIRTNIDPTVLYPIAYPTLTLTGLKPGSEVRIFDKATQTEVAGIENSGTIFVAKYEYTADVDVYIVVLAMGYQWMQIDYTLTAEDATIPVQQVIDRVYANT